MNNCILIFWIAIIHIHLSIHTFHCNTKALMACHRVYSKPVKTRSLQWRQTPRCFMKLALRCKWYHVSFHISHLVCFRDINGTLPHWVTYSVGVSSGPQGRPLRGLYYTAHTPFFLLHARVSPSVVHVCWYTNGWMMKGWGACGPTQNGLLVSTWID